MGTVGQAQSTENPMSQDRKQLIRLASELPKGSEARRVLLAEIQKQGREGPGHEILERWLVNESRIDRNWLYEAGQDNSSSKAPQNLSEDNPIGPKEMWDVREWGGEDLGGKLLNIKTTIDGYDDQFTTLIHIKGEFTRRFDGGRSPAKIWTGKGTLTARVQKFGPGGPLVTLAAVKVNFSFTNGDVGAIKKAFDKALQKARAQTKASMARLDKPKVWSAVIGIEGSASHIQTFKTEADAKRALSNLKGIVSYDVVEGEQLWNKSVGTVG